MDLIRGYTYRNIPNLVFRTMRMADLPQVESMYHRTFGEWLFRPIRFAVEKRQFYNPGNNRHVWVAEHLGRIVAAVTGRPARVRVDGAELVWAAYGGVMCEPDYRELGIGTRLNGLAWESLRRAGSDGVFISGGRGLYRRMGSVKMGNYLQFVLRRSAFRLFDLLARLVRVRLGRLADAAALVALHKAERFGYLKTREDFRAPLAFRLANIHDGRLWVVERAGRPSAYALLSRYHDRRGRLMRREAWLTDFAGNRSVLMMGLAPIFRAMGLGRMGLRISGRDDEFRMLLRSTGVSGAWVGHGGTHVFLDPSRTFRRLRPYFARHLPDSGARGLGFTVRGDGGFRLTLGGERLDLQGIPDFASLVFGDRPDRWKSLLPRRGRLREALGAVFPIPFPPAGINWF